MARNKEFQPQKALDKAMHLFWKKGYAATSIGDLVAATGVQRYGLYGTFGDKHSLFLQALDHYRETAVSSMVRDLEAADASWPTIVAFFDRLLSMAHTPAGQSGCLMCNAAAELAVHDPAVADKMASYETRLSGLFEQALARAQARGELGANIPPPQGAGYLVGTTVGMFTLAKTPVTRTLLEDYLAVALGGFESLANA